MKILSVDTSSKNCSVAIVEVDKGIFNPLIVKNSDDERTHSQKLMPMIDECFKASGLTLNNINLIACCVGPGSFTGIRIGVASMKAFSDAKDISVVPVTALESLAYNISNKGYIIPIIDAKNSNVYSSIFLNTDIYSRIHEDVADTIDNIIQEFHSCIGSDNKDIYFVGDGSIKYKDLIISKFGCSHLYFANENTQTSLSLAMCAYNKYLNGIYGDSNFITPIYLRKSQAERNANGEK